MRPSGDSARSLAANGTEVWKDIARGRLLLKFHKVTPAAISIRKNAAATTQPERSQLLRPPGTCPACPADELVSRIHLSSLPRSLALCQRSSGGFARHFLIA